MAGADYRLCDVYGSKAFYDSNLNYEMSGDSGKEPYRYSGEEQYSNTVNQNIRNIVQVLTTLGTGLYHVVIAANNTELKLLRFLNSRRIKHGTEKLQ